MRSSGAQRQGLLDGVVGWGTLTRTAVRGSGPIRDGPGGLVEEAVEFRAKSCPEGWLENPLPGGELRGIL